MFLFKFHDFERFFPFLTLRLSSIVHLLPSIFIITFRGDINERAKRRLSPNERKLQLFAIEIVGPSRQDNPSLAFYPMDQRTYVQVFIRALS